jgi:hypothetical protein
MIRAKDKTNLPNSVFMFYSLIYFILVEYYNEKYPDYRVFFEIIFEEISNENQLRTIHNASNQQKYRQTAENKLAN